MRPAGRAARAPRGPAGVDGGEGEGLEPAPATAAEAQAAPRVTQALPPTLRDERVVRRLHLVVTAGRDAGRRHQSQGERTTIGTHASADLVLTDPTASGFHTELSLHDGQVVVRDLGSRNGTTLDGVRVAEAFARPSSLLVIGNTEVRLEVTPDFVPVPVSERVRFGAMVGTSIATRVAFHLLECAATCASTVLLEGETGTGKELAAEAIHREGPRRDRPFVVVDCGAIPPDLLESELFGHERGAFTGAVTARQGAFAAADGGTVFLDEIGELAPALQPKLLRVLERREVKPVGSNLHRRVDVRVIAATNRDLREEVNAQRFRSDLFYRIAVLRVRLPSLRERLEDLPVLIEAILDQLGVVEPAEVERLRGAAFVQHLARHRWPGNVRELRNYLERCCALHAQTPFGEPGRDGDPAAPGIDPRRPMREAREAWDQYFERRYLEELLRLHDDNVTAAARAAGLNRTYVHALLARHGLR